MSKLQINYLKHIYDECEFISNSIKPELTKNDFLKNEILKRAFVRSLEIIGESTKRITADIKLKWNTIEWKQMAGMRDKLIHDYFGINYSIVWDVAKNKIPTLKAQILEVIEQEGKNSNSRPIANK